MAILTTSYQMLAQTYVGNTGYADVYLRLYVKYNSQSIKDNTSSVSYKSTIYFASGTFYTGNTTTKMLEGSGATTVSQDAKATYYAGETTLNEISGTVWHNAEGKYTTWGKATFISTPWGWETIAEATAELPTIPRYATSNQSLNSKTETTIKMNWSSDNTIDYLWYSTNNGSSWTGVDVTDGTGGTYTISGLTANTAYTVKTRVRRKDSQLTTDSSALSVTTYKVPTNSLNSKTETTVKINWSVDSTADYIWYSKDNGTNWTAVGSVSATSGSYTVSGLSANTAYNIKTRVRRKATQTTYNTSAVSVTTYNYPYITAVETANLTIGNSQKLTLYNPLSRTVTIKMYKDSTSGTQLYSGTTSSTTITFTPTASTLYATIPSSKSGKCVYSAIYSSSTKTITGAYTYVINEVNCKPTFTNFAYADTDDSTKAITGNDKILINNNSNCLFHINTTNKAVGNNSASIVSYKCEWGSQSATGVYSGTESVKVQINNSSGNTLKVTAIDSRGLSTTVTKTITAIDYTNAIVNSVEIQRLNGVDLETYLGLKMTIWKGNWLSGTNTSYDNQLKYIGYRIYDGSSWTNYFDITSAVMSNVSSYTSGNSIVFTLPISKKIPIHANGSSGGFTIGKAYTIQVLIKDGTSTTIFTPNSYQATAQGTVPDGKVGFSRYKDSNGNYHYAINGMPNSKYALFIHGNAKFSKSDFPALSLERTGSAYAASIEFNNQNGVLGYIGMSETPNGGLRRYLADISANYLFLDTGNYQNYVLPKSGGTVTGDLVIKQTDEPIVRVDNGTHQIDLLIGNSGNRGIYDRKNGNWILYKDSNNIVYFKGNADNTYKAKVTNTNPSSITDYYPIWNTGAGDSTDLRANNGYVYQTQEGTTSANGRGLLSLGNNKATGTAGNKFGCLRLYSKLSGYINLQYADETGNNTIFLPNYNGNAVVSTTGTNYERLSDGTLYVYGSVTCPALAKNSGTSVSVTFPQKFLDTNYRISLTRTGSGSYWSYVEGSCKTKAVGSATMAFWNNATDQSAACTFDYIAIGRWK